MFPFFKVTFLVAKNVNSVSKKLRRYLTSVNQPNKMNKFNEIEPLKSLFKALVDNFGHGPPIRLEIIVYHTPTSHKLLVVCNNYVAH